MIRRAIVYRNNRFWSQLHDDILLFSENEAMVELVHVFPEGTSDEDIAFWYKDHQERLSDLEIICDGTFSKHLPRILQRAILDDLQCKATERLLGNQEVVEVYHAIFGRLIEVLGIRKVQLVPLCLGDYNPLKIDGCEDRNDKTSQKYVEAFTSIMPNGILIETVSFEDLQVPDPDSSTLVIAHHHVWKGREGCRKFENSCRVVCPYLSGIQEFTRGVVDIGDLFPGDVVDEVRKLLREHSD